jgi:3-oxoadipate enol-lactonase
MSIYDRGSGPALIVIPGVQGRWEWMRPALDALSGRCRTISYSLSGDMGSGRRLDRAMGFEDHIRQLDAVMDAVGLESAAVCGVSFGGFIAVRYAACRPGRVSSLVLVSAPAPGWTPSPQQARWLARPWLSAPMFVLSSPVRLWPEIRCGCGSRSRAVRFMVRQGLRAALAPMIPSLMAQRIADARRIDFGPDCGRVRAPALVITGEPGLDRVVPPRITERYASLIPGARHEVLPGTGHLGLLTQPSRFAQIVSEFVHAHHH